MRCSTIKCSLWIPSLLPATVAVWAFCAFLISNAQVIWWLISCGGVMSSLKGTFDHCSASFLIRRSIQQNMMQADAVAQPNVHSYQPERHTSDSGLTTYTISGQGSSATTSSLESTSH